MFDTNYVLYGVLFLTISSEADGLKQESYFPWKTSSSGPGILRRVEFVSWLVWCFFETKILYAECCLYERKL